MQRLTFTLDVEDDQEVPPVGTAFDASNNNITFMDVRLTGVQAMDDDDDPDRLRDINDVTLPDSFVVDGDTGRPPEGTDYLISLPHYIKVQDLHGVEFDIVGSGPVQGSVKLRDPAGRCFAADGDYILRPAAHLLAE